MVHIELWISWCFCTWLAVPITVWPILPVSSNAHYWLNKGYIELYENGGKIWFTSSPSCHNSNSISKLECVLTLFFVPWFLREHTHTQKWLKFWHCPNCLEHFFIEGGFIYIFTGLLQGVLEGYCMIFLQFIAFSFKKKHSKYLHLGHQVFPLHTLYCIFRASLINPIWKNQLYAVIMNLLSRLHSKMALISNWKIVYRKKWEFVYVR